MQLRNSSQSPQEITTLAWAFAQLGTFDGELFKLIADAAIASSKDFKLDELALIAWSFATLLVSDTTLFGTITDELNSKINRFEPNDPRDVFLVSWALDLVGLLGSELKQNIKQVLAVAGNTMDRIHVESRQHCQVPVYQPLHANV